MLRHMVIGGLAFALWVGPLEARGEVVAPTRQVELGLTGGPSVGFAKRGLTTGGVVVGSYRFSGTPWFVTGRGALALATAANDVWDLSHYHATFALGGGVARAVGVGTLALEAGLGGLLVWEVRERHQIERLTLAGVEARSSASWSVGPHGYLEGSAVVRFVDQVSCVVAVGVAVVGAEVDGRARIRWGPQGRLGIAYAF